MMAMVVLYHCNNCRLILTVNTRFLDHSVQSGSVTKSPSAAQIKPQVFYDRNKWQLYSE